MKKLVFLAGFATLLIIGFFIVTRDRAASVPYEAAAVPSVPNTGETEPGIAISPSRVLQGDPAEISVSATSSVTSIVFNGKPARMFAYQGKQRALVPIDLSMKPGTYPVLATLADGQRLTSSLVVEKRSLPEAPLGIPDSFGGNTQAGEQNLLSSLAKDNAVINSVPTASTTLWTQSFGYPVKDPVVTDVYGYTRLTVNSTVSHKGTDFRAPIGTDVFAMNSGVVRVARFFTAYGNAIIVDHGLGLQTMYMHLSELAVKEGDRVEKGQIIGKSGNTGYAEGPHLHLTVKINGVSIDPETFMKLLGNV